MNNQLRVIATSGDYVVVNQNGIVNMYFGKSIQSPELSSAYELIRTVKERDIRLDLLRQWHEDLDGQKKAEELTPVVEGILKGDQ